MELAINVDGIQMKSAIEASTLFPDCVWLPGGFIGRKIFCKLFFGFF